MDMDGWMDGWMHRKEERTDKTYYWERERRMDGGGVRILHHYLKFSPFPRR